MAVDVTGMPVGGLGVPASTQEIITTELMLEHLSGQGVTDRLELVLVDRGVTSAAATRLGGQHGLQVRRAGRDDKQPMFRPFRHAWRVEVAHGLLGRSRRLAKSFENTTSAATGWLQVACVATTPRCHDPVLPHPTKQYAPPCCVDEHADEHPPGRAAQIAKALGHDVLVLPEASGVLVEGASRAIGPDTVRLVSSEGVSTVGRLKDLSLR